MAYPTTLLPNTSNTTVPLIFRQNVVQKTHCKDGSSLMDYLIQGVVCYYDVRISNLLMVNRMCYLALHTRHCERSCLFSWPCSTCGKPPAGEMPALIGFLGGRLRIVGLIKPYTDKTTRFIQRLMQELFWIDVTTQFRPSKYHLSRSNDSSSMIIITPIQYHHFFHHVPNTWHSYIALALPHGFDVS